MQQIQKTQATSDGLIIAGKTYDSRLLVGTGILHGPTPSRFHAARFTMSTPS